MAGREERHIHLLHTDLGTFALGGVRRRRSLPIGSLVARQGGIARLRGL